ncbi:protection of telomeres protein 1 [Denticeps clupeoides]|uniref:protection of telomeres protein 1 n=1 Tax=Denticeps clupeoides TaxID=299321 RepID=UPI0010A53CDA|nr:protection of telomeres protein 1 [Denticeps clupeoides]
MPVYVVKALSDLETQAPQDLHVISIPLLNENSTDKTGIRGTVISKGCLICRGENPNGMLKTVIQDHDPQQSSASEKTSINAILFGELAKDFSHSVNQGDVVLMAGFTVKSTTEKKDRLHPCILHLDGQDACVYVCPSTPPSRQTSEPKYDYVPLNELQPGTVVNVYAVVTFFKQPFPTKGTDYCSTLKLTDQSGVKVGCTIFSSKLEDHPKIFMVGDIIRLHRMKTQMFSGSMSLLTSWRWSAVTFDGTVDSAIVPRTSSKTFHFGEEDRRMVATLRQWAAEHSLLPSEPTIPLSAVQPKTFFNLTCQVLAKACIDSSCILLKVWDGSKCTHPLVNVAVEPGTLEGASTLAKDRQNLTANILVFDNHVEFAQAVKPDMFLRIYNLHAVSQPQSVQLGGQQERLSFHLHGGNSFGRGLCVLPSDSPDLQQLKGVLESYVDIDNDNDDDLMNDDLYDMTWYTPPESLCMNRVEFSTVRTCEHSLLEVTLAQVKDSRPPAAFHVRAQVKSYQPRRLYQSLKLFCPQCKTIQEVPDEETLRRLFQEALSNSSSKPEDLTVTLVTNSKDLVYIQGGTFEEVCCLAPLYKKMIALTLTGGKRTLMDFTVPFLFCGKRRHYGCKRCSQPTLLGTFEGIDVWNKRNISEALGVQLMQYRLLMKLELEDGTASLEALVWEDAESFFHVSAADAADDQESQDQIQQITNMLLPPDSSMDERPWLDLCLSTYSVEDHGRSQVCCQILKTETRGALMGARSTRQ